MALDNALLYRAAERAIRMRDDVLAIVSHDLRTPLGTILMQAEQLVGDPGVRKAGVGIMRSAHRMNRLIGDLLDASAINAGQLALDIKPHDAVEIAREALDMFRSQAEASGDRVLRQAPRASRSYIIATAIASCRCCRICSATRSSSRRAVAPSRFASNERVTTFTSRCRTPVKASHQHSVPFLFDRFWRGQQRHNGAGLGLFIARGIIVAHGSELRVETKLGIGSRFFFNLRGADAVTTRTRYVLGILGLAAVCFVTRHDGAVAACARTVATLLWVPAAIGFSVCLLYGLRWWPGIALGTLLDLLRSRHPDPAGARSSLAVDVGEVLIGCWLLRVLGFRPELDRVSSVSSLRRGLLRESRCSARPQR